jgi:hypothetical protein
MFARFSGCKWIPAGVAVPVLTRLRQVSTDVCRESKAGGHGPATFESNAQLASLFPVLDSLADHLWLEGTSHDRDELRELRREILQHVLATAAGGWTDFDWPIATDAQAIPEHAIRLYVGSDVEGVLDVLSRSLHLPNHRTDQPLYVVIGVPMFNPQEWQAVQAVYSILRTHHGHSLERLAPFLEARSEYVQNNNTRRLIRIIVEAYRIDCADAGRAKAPVLYDAIARVEHFLLAANIQRVHLDVGTRIPPEYEKLYFTRRVRAEGARSNDVVGIMTPAFIDITSGKLVGTQGTALVKD